MSAEQQHRNVSDWLQQATRGLPSAVRQLAREELLAHYEDALAEHLGAGLSQSQAQAIALRELGSPQETARGFQQTHLAPRRYRRAALLSLLPSLGVVIMAVMAPLALFMVLGWLTFATTAYVLHTLRTLLVQQFAYHRGDYAIRLILAGLLFCMAVNTTLSLQGDTHSTVALLVNEPLILFRADFPLPVSGMALVLQVIFLAAAALVGIGWLWLSTNLADAESARSGGVRTLLRSLRFSFLITGTALLVHMIAAFFTTPQGVINNANPLALTAALAGVAGIVKFALCCFVFLKFAARDDHNPAQLA